MLGSEVKGEEEEEDDGKSPSFTVLLHGSLKVEGMVALTRVRYVLTSVFIVLFILYILFAFY